MADIWSGSKIRVEVRETVSSGKNRMDRSGYRQSSEVKPEIRQRNPAANTAWLQKEQGQEGQECAPNQTRSAANSNSPQPAWQETMPWMSSSSIERRN